MPGRVVHLIETPGPGGAETVLAELVTRSAAPWVASAIIPSADGWLGLTLPAQVQSVASPTKGAQIGPLDLRYIREIRALLRRERPAILHAHSFDAAFYGALAVRGSQTRLAATFHGVRDVARHGLRNRLKWVAMRRLWAIVCVSNALRETAMCTPGIPSAKMRVIHNGIDLTRFRPAPHPRLRARLGLADGVLLLGAVGNVRRPKGYDLLLRAMAQVADGGCEVHLVIAGDDEGPLADELRALRTRLNLQSRVTFLGFTEDVPMLLNGIDLFVLSSTSEGFSLATVQALASGVPVLITKSGGPEEIVQHGINGYLVDAGSADALAQGMLTMSRDPALRSRLAKAARARAESAFSLDMMVQRYRDLHDDMLSL